MNYQKAVWDVGIMAQWVKPLPVMPVSHWSIAYLPAVPLLIQVPANVPGKSSEDESSTWALFGVGHQDGVTAFCVCVYVCLSVHLK